MMTQYQSDVVKQQVRNLYSKLEILDSDLTVIREMTGILKGGDYSIYAKVGERRTCNVELQITKDTVPSPTSPIWINKRVRVYVGILHLQLDEIIWFPLGTFAITDPSQDIAITAENTFSIQGIDFTAYLDGTLGGNLENKVIINSGDYVYNTLQNVFANFTNFQTNIQQTDTKVPYKIEKDPDDTVWDIVEELLELYLHYEGFFDVNGTFVYQPMSDLVTDSVVWDFSAPENNLIESATINYLWDDVRNRVTVNGKDDDGVYPSYTTCALSTDKGWEDCPYTVDKMGETKAFQYRLPANIVDRVWNAAQAETDTSSPLYEIKTLAQQNQWDKETAINETVGAEVRRFLVGKIKGSALKTSFESYGLSDIFDKFISSQEIAYYSYNPRSITISETSYYKVEQCVTRAQYELDTRLSGSESVRLSIVPIYGLDANQLIYLDMTINDTPIQGKYCIDEITCKLGEAGLMDVTCHKVTKNRFAFNQEILYEEAPDDWQYTEEIAEKEDGEVAKNEASTASIMTMAETTANTFLKPIVINNIFDDFTVAKYNLTVSEQKDLRDLIRITKGTTHRIRLVNDGKESKLYLNNSELFRDAGGNWYISGSVLGADLIHNAGLVPGTSSSLSSYWNSHSINIKLFPQVIPSLDTFLPTRVIKDFSLSHEDAKELAWVGACYGRRTGTQNDFRKSVSKHYIEIFLTNSGAVIKIAESMSGYSNLHRDSNGNWYSDSKAYGQCLFTNKGWVGAASSLPMYTFDEETNGYLRIDYENTLAGRNDILS